MLPNLEALAVVVYTPFLHLAQELLDKVLLEEMRQLAYTQELAVVVLAVLAVFLEQVALAVMMLVV
jgi:hypothetical protein